MRNPNSRVPRNRGAASGTPVHRPGGPAPVERLPARARAGIGGQADLRYCPCGGKRRDGKCVRGCDS